MLLVEVKNLLWLYSFRRIKSWYWFRYCCPNLMYYLKKKDGLLEYTSKSDLSKYIQYIDNHRTYWILHGLPHDPKIQKSRNAKPKLKMYSAYLTKMLMCTEERNEVNIGYLAWKNLAAGLYLTELHCVLRFWRTVMSLAWLLYNLWNTEWSQAQLLINCFTRNSSS